MTYEEFCNRLVVEENVRAEDGRLVVHMSIGRSCVTQRSPEQTGIGIDEYVDAFKKSFYEDLFGKAQLT